MMRWRTILVFTCAAIGTLTVALADVQRTCANYQAEIRQPVWCEIKFASCCSSCSLRAIRNRRCPFVTAYSRKSGMLKFVL